VPQPLPAWRGEKDQLFTGLIRAFAVAIAIVVALVLVSMLG
jgi:hypothetical protein